MSDSNDKDKKSEQRRNVVKGITIVGTGVTLSKWSKPVVESVLLPAHAQTSVARVAGAMIP